MRIALCADLHFRGADLEHCTAQWRALIDRAATYDARVIACAGDVLDKASIGDRHQADGAVIRAITQPLAAWLRGDAHRRFITVVGNHDKSGAHSMDALTFLDEIPGCHVARSVEAIVIEDTPIIAMPWYWTGGNPAALVESVLPRITRFGSGLFLAHIQRAGAAMSATENAPLPSNASGDCLPGEWIIGDEFFERFAVFFRKTALGDFHRRQPHYIGGLRQLSFAEEGNPTGFEIWDSETNVCEYHELNRAPRFETIIVADQEELDAVRLSRDPLLRQRVHCRGFIPGGEIVARIESMGVEVDHDVPPAERIARVEPGEVPEDILSQPHRIIDLWASKQTPPVDPARVAAMHAELDRCAEEGVGT